MNISKILPSKTLLSSFNRLETREVVQIGRVSKHWCELINENRIFWRILELQMISLKSRLSALEQFNQRRDSTLREASIQTQEAPTHSNLFSVIGSLQTSSESLLVFNFSVPSISLGEGEAFADLLHTFQLD